MAIVKRVILFLLLNLCIVTTVSVITQLLGLDIYLGRQGINFSHLAVFCMIWGLASAFISLVLSRSMAKWLMGVQIIDPTRASGEAKRLLDHVHALARKAGMRHMPQVGLFSSKSPNAFATGPSAKRSLIALSDSLISGLSEEELGAVIGHEITHITSGDMMTMTLIQGVINGFVMFLARACAYIAAQAISGRSRDSRSSVSPMVYFLCVTLFEICFMMLGMLLVAAYSRWREFRADTGGAQLTSRPAMANALRAIDCKSSPAQQQGAFDSLQIHTKRGRFLSLLATHPPIEKRIARLQVLQTASP